MSCHHKCGRMIFDLCTRTLRADTKVLRKLCGETALLGFQYAVRRILKAIGAAE